MVVIVEKMQGQPERKVDPADVKYVTAEVETKTRREPG